MEDNSIASSDSDNALLSGNVNGCIGSNATTQTPEVSRHEIKVTEPSNENSSIIVYKLDTQKPISELEQEAKNLSIPDVVVEYIKDSYHRQDDGLGSTNPAFEPQELIVVRTPSSISLREDAAKGENEMALLPMGKESPMYFSVNKDQQKLGDNLPPVRFLDAMDPSLRASQTSLSFPRSVPPSPNFGYRPLESETSAVYTIISPVRYVGNGKETDKETEMRIMAELQAQMEKEKATTRKFEFCQAPADIEHRRKNLQYATDLCSTLFLIPGIFIAIFTPLIIIPMFSMPLKYYIPFIGIFGLSGIISVIILAISGVIGNIVWHYDETTKKMRPKFHCGSGPLRHFWGNGFYRSYSDVIVPEKIV